MVDRPCWCQAYITCWHVPTSACAVMLAWLGGCAACGVGWHIPEACLMVRRSRTFVGRRRSRPPPLRPQPAGDDNAAAVVSLVGSGDERVAEGDLVEDKRPSMYGR